MARAKAKLEPTFDICFVGPGIEPSKITPRILYDVLAAIQDMASGRDPWEMSQVPPEKTIGLLRVSRGSAVYRCISHAPTEALRNLAKVATILSAPISPKKTDSCTLASILHPLESLSHVAKNIGCELQIRALDSRQLFTVKEDDYERVSTKLLIKGDTTVSGTVLRAGGATEMKCFLRIPGRRKGLYCNVRTKEVVRRLGEHLYQNIVATGTATWIHGTWRIVSFAINDFSQPELGDPMDAIQKLRQAGLSAWDTISDPDTLIRGS